ncbi:hypothetical protein D9M68_280210 [compost metagenome]
MKNVLHGCIASLSLVLCACVAPPAVPPSDDEVYKSYMHGHMEMLRTHAPWMTDAQRQKHAEAQAAEVIKSLKAQERLGRVIPPVMIPLPAPPSTSMPKAAEAPSPSLPEAEVTAAAPQAGSAVQPQATAVEPVPVVRAMPTASIATAQLPTPEATFAEPAGVGPLAFIDGTYVIEDGSYSMDIEQDGSDLVVVEPNKRSIYVRQGDGSYYFSDPTTGSTFSLRYVDERTVEADRVPSSGSPSVLKRVEVQAATEASSLNQAYAAIAQRYGEMAQSDPDNAQAWTMCSAVAFKRSLADGEDFSRYARQMSETLKLIAVDSINPCSDAIPDAYW